MGTEHTQARSSLAEELKTQLQGLSNHLPHAILLLCRKFSEQPLDFAMLHYLCADVCGIPITRTPESETLLSHQLNHPDLFAVDPEKGNIKREDVEPIFERLRYPPQSAKRRLIILERVQRLGSHSANCLLKSLEEPLDRCLFVLTAPAEADVLPTLTSRCVRLHLRTPSHSQNTASVAEMLAERFEGDEVCFLSNLVQRIQHKEISELLPFERAFSNPAPISVPQANRSLDWAFFQEALTELEKLSRKYLRDELIDALIQLTAESARTGNVRSPGLQWLVSRLRDWKKWSDFNPSSLMRLTELATIAAVRTVG